jgi:hypothetical protein
MRFLIPLQHHLTLRHLLLLSHFHLAQAVATTIPYFGWSRDRVKIEAKTVAIRSIISLSPYANSEKKRTTR